MRSLLILLLLCGSAAAGDYTPESLAISYARGWRPLAPPPEYDKPYTGELTLYRIPLAEIPDKCQNIPKVLGCSYWAKNLTTCRVYIPVDVVPGLQKAILQHEMGHCHGWVHDFPGKAARDAKMEAEQAARIAAEIAKGKEVAERLIQTGMQRLKDNSIFCKVPPFPEGCP